MAVSGRFALLVALGVVPVVAAGTRGADAAWLALVGWLALTIGAGVLDLSLAASPRILAIVDRLLRRAASGSAGIPPHAPTGDRELRKRH